MSDLYFAYGSNLKATRMVERIPSARDHGVAMLEGMRVSLDKLARDGSGKANLTLDTAARVWGFVYRIERDDWTALDGFEPGYSRALVEVVAPDGTEFAAQTYVADEPVAGLAALAWYRALIVEGACEHGLPDDYVQRLRALPVGS